MIIGIILGILIWQTVTTIVIAIKDSEEVTAFIGGGIPFIITVGICLVIRKIMRKIHYWNARSILTDKNGNWFYCRPEIVNKLQEDESRNLQFPKWTDEIKTKYPKDLWSKYIQKNYCTFEVGNFRYAPKVIWSQFTEIKQ